MVALDAGFCLAGAGLTVVEDRDAYVETDGVVDVLLHLLPEGVVGTCIVTGGDAG